jgi:hypothetical protein
MARKEAEETLYAATASGETLPIVKETLVNLTMVRSPIRIFVSEITEEFILGFDVMHASDAFVDLRRHVPGLEMRKCYCGIPGRDRIQPLYEGQQRRSSGSV